MIRNTYTAIIVCLAFGVVSTNAQTASNKFCYPGPLESIVSYQFTKPTPGSKVVDSLTIMFGQCINHGSNSYRVECRNNFYKVSTFTLADSVCAHPHGTETIDTTEYPTSTMIQSTVFGNGAPVVYGTCTPHVFDDLDLSELTETIFVYKGECNIGHGAPIISSPVAIVFTKAGASVPMPYGGMIKLREGQTAPGGDGEPELDIESYLTFTAETGTNMTFHTGQPHCIEIDELPHNVQYSIHPVRSAAFATLPLNKDAHTPREHLTMVARVSNPRFNSFRVRSDDVPFMATSLTLISLCAFSHMITSFLTMIFDPRKPAKSLDA